MVAGGSVSTNRRASLPRLQEFAFLEFALAGVVRGDSYEQIRGTLISYMKGAREGESLGGNTARFQLERPGRYVYADNVTEALKELMRLGLVERARLPSEGRTIRHYAGTTFAATPAGKDFFAFAQADRSAARDRLLGLLRDAHPQLAGYLTIAAETGLVVPLANWGEVAEPRSREKYLELLAGRAAEIVRSERAGWSASASDIAAYVREYIDAKVGRSARRGKGDPFTRNEDFVRDCEKAMVKLAFDRAGSPMDYISHDVVRRWLRELDVASFSYHVPGPQALRLWGTAQVSGEGPSFSVRRRTTDADYDAVVGGLSEGYQLVRSTESAGRPWVSIYRLRAAVCYQLKVSERVFDVALNDVIHERRGTHLPFRVNLELYEFGVTPPSERPLKVQTNKGERDVHSLALIPRSQEVSA